VKIILTLTENPAKHQYYIDWIGQDTGIEVVTLSKNSPRPDLAQYDGLVLSGGIDIHPELYGGSAVYPKAPSRGWDKERDEFEKRLFLDAFEHNLPVLAICRGLQLVNVALGGTLIQDLGKLDALHEGNPDKVHPVRLKHNSILSGFTKTKFGQCNSAHHQAIEKLGKGLMVAAASDENVIEAVEWEDPRDKPFLIAIQWHPERMNQIDELDGSPLCDPIREFFLDEVKKSKATKL
jgi:putative glutamine amidotransferase